MARDFIKSSLIIIKAKWILLQSAFTSVRNDMNDAILIYPMVAEGAVFDWDSIFSQTKRKLYQI